MASEPGTDLETRLDMPRSLKAIGVLLKKTGDVAGRGRRLKRRYVWLKKPDPRAKQVMKPEPWQEWLTIITPR